MARHKLQQVLLVSADGTTQPPFPGGWVLAIFEAVHNFAPEYVSKYRLPSSRRTHVRLKGGQPVKQSTYDEIETGLIALVSALFPTVAAINDFATKYVNEYFRLWRTAAEFAPRWVTAFGFQPERSGVLARTLLRDLVLRLCYLESCERALRGSLFSREELGLLRHDAPARVYAALITERARRQKLSMEKLAEDIGLYDEKIRRLKVGKVGPDWPLLKKLAISTANHRLLAGIGFIDVLLRKLGLTEAVLLLDIFRVAEVFLPAHRRALFNLHKTLPSDLIPGIQNGGTNQFAQIVAIGDNLLLHPGFETVWPKMPDALWRAQLYTLRFASVVDLAQACLQYAEPENDRELTRFLDIAERKSDSCPFGWMDELRQPRNILPFLP
jgi:hypothetical protein